MSRSQHYYESLVGRKFNFLTLEQVINPKKSGLVEALFRCECGRTITKKISYVKSGNFKSCGCMTGKLISKSNKKRARHGMAKSRTYSIWKGMIRRTNPNLAGDGFDHYREKGISICERWKTFDNFFEDMGIAPPEMSIDRYPDRQGNYEPSNCRWATAQQQRENQDSYWKNRMHQYEMLEQLYEEGLTHWAIYEMTSITARTQKKILGIR